MTASRVYGLRRWAAVAVLGSAAVMTTGIAPANAGGSGAAPTAVRAEAPCGYYASRDISFYNHCGPTTVQIKLDVVRGFDKTICVRPGSTRLGLRSQIRDASYVGGAGCAAS